MANPQKENGYTAIANEILEALAGIRIPGEARQCLDVILRKTYGFHKKKDIISLTQFMSITKNRKQRICESLSKLREMNIIITEKRNEKGNIYLFNKDFDTWKPLRKTVPITENRNNRYGKPLQSLRKTGPTKDILKKRKIESENNLNFLKNIDTETIREIATGYMVSEDFVKNKAEDLVLYCQAKGRFYKNYKALLLNAIKRDKEQGRDTRPRDSFASF